MHLLFIITLMSSELKERNEGTGVPKAVHEEDGGGVLPPRLGLDDSRTFLRIVRDLRRASPRSGRDHPQARRLPPPPQRSDSCTRRHTPAHLEAKD